MSKYDDVDFPTKESLSNDHDHRHGRNIKVEGMTKIRQGIKSHTQLVINFIIMFPYISL